MRLSPPWRESRSPGTESGSMPHRGNLLRVEERLKPGSVSESGIKSVSDPAWRLRNSDRPAAPCRPLAAPTAAGGAPAVRPVLPHGSSSGGEKGSNFHQSSGNNKPGTSSVLPAGLIPNGPAGRAERAAGGPGSRRRSVRLRRAGDLSWYRSTGARRTAGPRCDVPAPRERAGGSGRKRRRKSRTRGRVS